MCGIIGYIGGRNAAVEVYEGLKRLEYRGYDSAGAAFCGGDKLPRSGDGVVVDDARRTQALHPGGVDRRRGGVGRKAVGSVDVVVDVLGNHGREAGLRQYGPQLRQTLLRRGGVETVQNRNIYHI